MRALDRLGEAEQAAQARALVKQLDAVAALRGDVAALGGRKVERLLDYAPGLDGLPKSDVLKFLLSGGASCVVRPSGTEPKLKLYVSVSADSREAAEAEEARLAADVEAIIGV